MHSFPIISSLYLCDAYQLSNTPKACKSSAVRILVVLQIGIRAKVIEN